MPAVNAVLWINMILDPVLGLNGVAVGGINNLIDGLRDWPVLGSFFSLWPEFVDAFCGADLYDLIAVGR